jgi:hypothetical protein
MSMVRKSTGMPCCKLCMALPSASLAFSSASACLWLTAQPMPPAQARSPATLMKCWEERTEDPCMKLSCHLAECVGATLRVMLLHRSQLLIVHRVRWQQRHRARESGWPEATEGRRAAAHTAAMRPSRPCFDAAEVLTHARQALLTCYAFSSCLMLLQRAYVMVIMPPLQSLCRQHDLGGR